MSAPPLTVSVKGRPAPKGSKEYGSAGQMLEVSRYLPAWRRAVRKGVLEAYAARGVTKADLPLFTGPVLWVGVLHMHLASGPITSKPDLDKLIRAVWDELTECRVWIDDSQVVSVIADKRRANATPGAQFTVSEWSGARFTVSGWSDGWPVES